MANDEDSMRMADDSVAARADVTPTTRGVRPVLFGVIFAVTAGALFSCSSVGGRHREIGAAEFLDLARAPIGSAFHTSYIGATSSRAYLSVWSALPSSMGGGEDVCSCALAELPPEAVTQIRSGQNPWPK